MISSPSKERLKLINKSGQTLIVQRTNRLSSDNDQTNRGLVASSNQENDYGLNVPQENNLHYKPDDINNVTF